MPGEEGANDFTIEELEKLFNDDIQQETPPASKLTDTQTKLTDAATEGVAGTQAVTEDVDKTKAFAHRLKESTEKARAEEREAIAKAFGFNSYDEMQKSREKKLMEEKGLDPEQASAVVDELVKKRLEDDPRLKELESLRKQKIKEFGEKELAEIKDLTGGEITSLSQLPKEVIDLWKSEGSLKSAYLKLEGEKLITKIRSEQSKGSTSHLVTPTGVSTISTTKRPLTAQERMTWKVFNPGLTDEELNKMTVEIK